MKKKEPYQPHSQSKLGGVSEKLRKPNAMKLALIAEVQPILSKNQSKFWFFAQLALC